MHPIYTSRTPLGRCLALGLVLLSLLAGCAEQGGNAPARTATVRLRLGNDAARRATSLVSTRIPRQRLRELPVDIMRIFVRVTRAGQDIPGSPFPMPLETAEITLTLLANVSYSLTLEAMNQRGMPIFLGTTTVRVQDVTETEVELNLSAREVTNLVATQGITPALGGELVVTDPQSPVQGLQVTIPTGALPQTMTVSLVEIHNPTDIPVLINQAGVIVDLRAESPLFLIPLTVAFPINEPLIRDLGLDITQLVLWHFVPALGQWIVLPTQTLDLTRRVITASISETGLYVVGNAPPPGSGNRAPAADAQTLTVAEDTSLNILLTGSDPEVGALRFRITQAPTQGVLQGTPPRVVYTPAAHFHGRDTLMFTVHDGVQESPPALVTIDVTAVNDAPIVAATIADVRVDDQQNVSSTVLDLTVVFSDPDLASDVETLQLTVQNNTNPTLVDTQLVDRTLTLVYRPRQNGVAVITVRATDQAGQTAETSFQVTVERTFPFILGESRLGDPSRRLRTP